jgi:hypothetical protein
MVDIQWPHTANRHPVEDLQIIAPGEDSFIAPMHEDVPGGPGTIAEVSEGSMHGNVIEGEAPRVEMVQEVTADGDKDDEDEDEDGGKKVRKEARDLSASRVARNFVKKSLYWHARDRKYRVSREEHTNGQYRCPTRGCSGHLRRATYKMEDGQHVKLHACPSCMFMIRSADILDDHCAPAPAVLAEGVC